VPSRRALPTGDTPLTLVTYGGEPAKAYERLSVGSGPVGFTLPTQAAYAIIDCETAPVRWRADGVNPTATVGMRLLADERLLMDVADLSAVRFIAIAATANLNIHYF
jgi:hypothetical protein